MAFRRVAPLGSIVEPRAPRAIVQESWPHPSHLGKAGELTLVVQAQESWQTDQLSYYSGPDPGL